MSDLTPGFIVLNQGLDLQSPKIAAPPGTLLDMLNYEQVDFQGQKRIDGYTRYDGSLLPVDDFYLVEYNSEGRFEVGSHVFLQDKLWGVVVGDYPTGTTSFIAVIDHNILPEVGEMIVVGDESYEVYSGRWASEAGIPVEEFYEEVLEHAQVLRERVTELPGPVAGLHWFNDRLYAVASVTRVELPTDATGVMYPNQMAGDSLILKVDGRNLYLAGTAPGNGGSEMASLFQSRTEQQALDELGDASRYGWEFIHQGWLVPFENGVSLYGDLAALNQNRKGVGVQGPTSTDGNQGKPLTVTQKVEIVNLPTQVNGWKTSDSRTTYNLNVGALDAVDDWTIYADAFFSWDGETGVVSSTGINSGPLEEYSPNATVEVEV